MYINYPTPMTSQLIIADLQIAENINGTLLEEHICKMVLKVNGTALYDVVNH